VRREMGRGSTYRRAWLGIGARVWARCESDGGGGSCAQAGLTRTKTPSDKRAQLVSGSAQRGGVPLRSAGKWAGPAISAWAEPAPPGLFLFFSFLFYLKTLDF
jgi:hypothetical protein